MSANRTARRAAGVASGGAAGTFPDPASGNPPAMGFMMHDEFTRPVDATTYGDLRWPIQTLGTAPTAAQQVPTADTEIGITRLSTAVGSGVLEGGTLGMPLGTDRFIAALPAVGSSWMVKLKLVQTTQIEVWSGFQELTGRVNGGANDFIGVRAVAGGAGVNWFGVVRNGAVETATDLLIAADTTWRVMGFTRTASGVEWRVYDASDVRALTYDVVATVTTNFPNAALAPVALGVAAVTGGTREADIDFWSLGGRVAR